MSDHAHKESDWAEEDPSARGTWLIGWVGAFLVVVAVAGIAGLYYSVESSSARRILSASSQDAAYRKVELDQRKLLRTGGEITHPYEPDKRVKVMPIDRAMHEIVKEHQGR